jgi:ribulose-5-phosphate 4-epimerase/fuculose-1-phosphate aldolase
MSVATLPIGSQDGTGRSPQEREIRIQLAAAYRLVALFGWDDLIFTHISARLPGPEHHFLINPYGMTFDEITASSLVKVDLDGNVVEHSDYDVNPAGFTIHSAVHAAREDAHCVLHLHTTAGVAVSAQAEGLLPLNQTASHSISTSGRAWSPTSATSTRCCCAIMERSRSATPCRARS